jgi:hypothetical protein
VDLRGGDEEDGLGDVEVVKIKCESVTKYLIIIL